MLWRTARLPSVRSNAAARLRPPPPMLFAPPPATSMTTPPPTPEVESDTKTSLPSALRNSGVSWKTAGTSARLVSLSVAGSRVTRSTLPAAAPTRRDVTSPLPSLPKAMSNAPLLPAPAEYATSVTVPSARVTLASLLSESSAAYRNLPSGVRSRPLRTPPAGTLYCGNWASAAGLYRRTSPTVVVKNRVFVASLKARPRRSALLGTTELGTVRSSNASSRKGERSFSRVKEVSDCAMSAVPCCDRAVVFRMVRRL